MMVNKYYNLVIILRQWCTRWNTVYLQHTYISSHNQHCVITHWNVALLCAMWYVQVEKLCSKHQYNMSASESPYRHNPHTHGPCTCTLYHKSPEYNCNPFSVWASLLKSLHPGSVPMAFISWAQIGVHIMIRFSGPIITSWVRILSRTPQRTVASSWASPLPPPPAVWAGSCRCLLSAVVLDPFPRCEYRRLGTSPTIH